MHAVSMIEPRSGKVESGFTVVPTLAVECEKGYAKRDMRKASAMRASKSKEFMDNALLYCLNELRSRNGIK